MLDLPVLAVKRGWYRIPGSAAIYIADDWYLFNGFETSFLRFLCLLMFLVQGQVSSGVKGENDVRAD
jgi:hypothetical protein